MQGIKGTVSVILSDHQYKMAVPDLQRYPCNLNVNKNMEETVVCQTQKVFISLCLSVDKECVQITFAEKP